MVVCVFRAFKTTFQRLLLYHIAIALLCECSFVLQIQINSPHSRWLCVTASYSPKFILHPLLVCIHSSCDYRTTCFCSPSNCSEETQTSGSMVNLLNVSVFSFHSHYPQHTCGDRFMIRVSKNFWGRSGRGSFTHCDPSPN